MKFPKYIHTVRINITSSQTSRLVSSVWFTGYIQQTWIRGYLPSERKGGKEFLKKKKCVLIRIPVFHMAWMVSVKLWEVFFLFLLFSCWGMSDSVTPWTVDRQAPLSMGFPRQEYWTDLSFPSLDPGIEPVCPASPVLAGRFFTTESPWKVCWDLNSGNPLCWNFNWKSFSQSTAYYLLSWKQLIAI